MLRSFIKSDVYRIMLGCRDHDALVATIHSYDVSYDGEVRRMHRDDGSEVSVAVVYVDGEAVQDMSVRDDVLIIQSDNVSARLRAVPPPRLIAQQAYGASA